MNAVTTFELYLERRLEELLNAVGYTASQNLVAKTAPWSDLRDFYNDIGLVIETDDIQAVRDRRHNWSHKRGELRSERDHEIRHDESNAWELTLPLDGLREDIDVLAERAKHIHTSTAERLRDRTFQFRGNTHERA